jgi:hypothetical protein
VYGGLFAIENMIKFFEVIFHVLTDSRRDFNVTTGVLKPHDCGSLLTQINRAILARLRTHLAS